MAKPYGRVWNLFPLCPVPKLFNVFFNRGPCVLLFVRLVYLYYVIKIYKFTAIVISSSLPWFFNE